jgi:hypothetical protein
MEPDAAVDKSNPGAEGEAAATDRQPNESKPAASEPQDHERGRDGTDTDQPG